LFAKGKSLKDPELLAHWSRYLCVLVSGFIETSVRTLLHQYAHNRSHPDIARFILHKLKPFTNAKMEKILKLAAEFDQGHEDYLRTATDGELKDAVDSVIRNRHLIAHGQDVGISFGTISKYYANVVRAIDAIERRFPS
jgi:hypothetical protein